MPGWFQRVSEPLPSSSGGHAEGGTNNFPGVFVRAGSTDGGMPVHVRRRGKAKERPIHAKRRGQVLDVEDVTFNARALYVDGEHDSSVAVSKIHFSVALTRTNRPQASYRYQYKKLGS